MGLRPDWPNLGVISLAHSYGFSNLVLPLLLHGIPLILAPRRCRKSSGARPKASEPLTLAAVPAMWRAWHEAGAIPAKRPPGHFRRRAAAVESGTIGLSPTADSKSTIFSAAPNAAASPTTPAQRRARTALALAHRMQNVNLSLNDEGCLTVRSRAVAETYWPEPSDLLGGGIFQTSDLAELKDGLVFLRGRLGRPDQRGRPQSVAGNHRARAARASARARMPGFGAPSRDAERTEIIVAVVAATEASRNGVEAIPAGTTARLAGAARLAICRITAIEPPRKNFPRGMPPPLAGGTQWLIRVAESLWNFGSARRPTKGQKKREDATREKLVSILELVSLTELHQSCISGSS